MQEKKVDSKIMLFALILVLITLFLLNRLFESNRYEGVWNYKKITSAKSLIFEGEEFTNRETYYVLEEIVNQYLDSYISKNDNENKGYEEYYKYLTKSYKNYLSKNKYKQVAETFFNKFYDETTNTMYTSQLITAVYKYDNDIYLCKLENKTNNEIGYIALKVSEYQQAFNIVYIE